MLDVLVLVCSTSMTPSLGDCTTSTALDTLILPMPAEQPEACLKLGQAYLAQTELGRSLKPGEKVKIMCRRQATLAQPSTPFPEPSGRAEQPEARELVIRTPNRASEPGPIRLRNGRSGCSNTNRQSRTGRDWRCR
jgi:hypothetical protein